MKDATGFLSQAQYDWLAAQLPQPGNKTKPTIPNNELLGGVLYVLKTGCRWQDIPASLCCHGYATCWRRFNYWRTRGALKLTWEAVLKALDRQGVLDLSLANLDGFLVQAPRFQGTGYSGKHHRTGTNVSLVTDKGGLPLANTLTNGNRNDKVSAEATVKKIRIGVKRRVKELNADKGYDSSALRRALRKRGIKPNIPERRYQHRRKRGPHPCYDKPKAKLRAVVERTISWLKYFRKLRYRWERKRCMFQAVVDLACLLICLRRVGI